MRPVPAFLTPSTLRTTLLTLAALACGVAVGRAGFREAPRETRLASAPGGVAAAPAVRIAERLSDPSGTTFPVSSAADSSAPAASSAVRPLFRPLVLPPGPERRREEPLPPRRPVPPPAAAAAALSAASREDAEEEGSGLALVGVTRVDGALRAVVEDPDVGLSRTVREGQSAFGYTVERISGTEVVLAGHEENLTLVLGEDKLEPKVEILGDPAGLRLTDPLNAPLRMLPQPAALAVARVLPKEGVLRRVRPSGRGASRHYRVEKTIDGLRYEARVAADGRILQISRQVRRADLPEAVVKAANEAVEGFQVNPSDTPVLWDRDGRRYYQVEIRKTGGRDEVDLHITPDGRLIGRG